MNDNEEKQNRRFYIYATLAIVIGVASLFVNMSTRNNLVAVEASMQDESSVVEETSKWHDSATAADDINKVLTFDNLIKYCKDNKLIDENDPNEEIYPKNASLVTINDFLHYMYKDINTNEDYSYILDHIDSRDLGYTESEVFGVEKLARDYKDFHYLKRDTSVVAILSGDEDESVLFREVHYKQSSQECVDVSNSVDVSNNAKTTLDSSISSTSLIEQNSGEIEVSSNE